MRDYLTFAQQTPHEGVHQLAFNKGSLSRLLRSLVFLLFLPWISACHGEEVVGSKVIGYNHTDKDIGTFTIRIGESSGGGGFLEAHRASGFSCCIGLPLPWHSGLTATVGWTDDHDENYQERVVPVARYEAFNIAMVSVHFLRNGEIRVFAPPVILGHPDYPLKGPEAGLYPGEDPVEVWEHGSKYGRE